VAKVVLIMQKQQNAIQTRLVILFLNIFLRWVFLCIICYDRVTYAMQKEAANKTLGNESMNLHIIARKA
jgi:hypothetical protein